MANDATDTTSAQDGADDGVHRLRDILVEEVSLVDRAANKRRFLIVKRSDMAKSAAPDKGDKTPPGAKKPKPKAKGPAKAAANRSKAKARGRSPGSYGASTRKAAKAADDEYDDDDETEKAAGDEGEDEDEDNEDEAEKADEYDDDEAEKADDAEENDDDETEKAAKVDDEDDDEAEKAAKADDEEYDDKPGGKRPAPKKTTTAKADGDDDSDDGDGDSDDGDSVVLPADLKTTVLRALTQGIERLVAVANRIKDADASDDDAAAYVPEDLAEEIDDIGELLEGIGERLPTTKAIAKGGARMAKDRLSRFQKALELLSQVLKELTEARQPAVPPGGGAGAGKHTTKRDAQPGVADLVTHVADLLAVVQQQQVQLDRIHKAHGTSNALVVEGSSRDRRAPADVSWPFDMNRPISRDNVTKATSFYDDAE